MSINVSSDVALPSVAKKIVWRIFGAGESLLNKRSTYDLIESVISRRYVASDEERREAIAEIRGWFVVYENGRRIKPDMIEPIADMIVEGFDSECSELMPWAIAWINSDVTKKIILSRWSGERVTSFIDAVLTVLEQLCDRDRILDSAQSARFAGVDVDGTIPRRSFDRDGKVQTFDELYTYKSKLVYFAIHSKVINLMKLILDVEPGRFESMISRLDHPVAQAWAADYMSPMAEPTDYRRPLEWIAESSCEDLIALAIVHTLNMINSLDRDRHYMGRVGEIHHEWRAASRQAPDELDRVATGLLNGLADRLGSLDSMDCSRWLGELLSRAPNMLDRGDDDQERPRRVGQLEEACAVVLARVVTRSWSEDLRAAWICGLRLNTRGTWSRHIVDVALAIGDSDRALANEMFRVALDQAERQVAEESADGHFYGDWSDWHHREWTNGLGAALALAHEDIDLVEWVSDRCRPLPLSVWDVEADIASFYSADPVAQFWFLVAFHAIVHRCDVGLVVDGAEVRALAELLWAHCHFVGQHLNFNNHAENSVAAEYAARCAIEYGEYSDGWLLYQVDSREVGPRARWALMCQISRKRACEQTDTDSEEKFAKEFLRVASDRFGDGSRFDLEELKYWSDLWVLIEATDEADRTAKAMLAILPRGREFRRVHGRVYEITVLKLLSLVAITIKLSPAMEDVVTHLYKDLWADSYVAEHGRTDRRQIDEWLSRSGLRV